MLTQWPLINTNIGDWLIQQWFLIASSAVVQIRDISNKLNTTKKKTFFVFENCQWLCLRSSARSSTISWLTIWRKKPSSEKARVVYWERFFFCRFLWSECKYQDFIFFNLYSSPQGTAYRSSALGWNIHNQQIDSPVLGTLDWTLSNFPRKFQYSTKILYKNSNGEISRMIFRSSWKRLSDRALTKIELGT